MAGFRVADHAHWRDRAEAEPQAERPRHAAAPRQPHVGELKAQVDRLGPVAYPARAYDRVFGGFADRSRVFLVLRFMLVAGTVLLLVNGVSGHNVIDHEVGAYRSSMGDGSINQYLAPTTPNRYEVGVDVGLRNQIVALFELDKGIVRVPTLDESGPTAYAFQVKIVRHDPYVQPILALRNPDGSTAGRIMPISDDGVTVRYDPIPIDQAGGYVFLLQSGRGAGHADLQLSVAEAQVRTIEQVRPDWLPLIGGIALATILVGAYTPGAALLSQIRTVQRTPEPYRMAEDARLAAPQPRPVRLARGEGVRRMHGPIAPNEVRSGWVRR